jgi:hypothetical protein
MLRPTQSLLASSRSERRRAFRHGVARGVWSRIRRLALIVAELAGAAWDLLVLCGAPLAYLAASYLVLDLPARWLFGGARFSWSGFLLFGGAAGLSALGVSRAMRSAPPVVPVRPAFARAMLGISWAVALLLTVADLSG